MSEIEQLRSASHWTIRDQPFSGQRCLELYEGCDGRFAGLCAPLDLPKDVAEAVEMAASWVQFHNWPALSGGVFCDGRLADRSARRAEPSRSYDASNFCFIIHQRGGIDFVDDLIHRWRK